MNVRGRARRNQRATDVRGSRWSSSAPRGTSRARVETRAKPPQTLTRSRHGRSSLTAYSISGYHGPAGRVVPRGSAGRVVPATKEPLFRWSSSAPRGTSRARVETPTKSPGTSPDLDTPPRSSSATRSADGEFRWPATRSAGVRVSAGRVVPARNEPGTCRDPGQVPADPHQISTRPLVPHGLLDQRNGHLVAYSISGCEAPPIPARRGRRGRGAGPRGRGRSRRAAGGSPAA